MQLIKRNFGFDAGHRVINHPGRCRDFHGHRYYGEIVFAYRESKEEGDIGYTIDFGDIKKYACGAFDHFLDHGMILNPVDQLKVMLTSQGKVYVMSYYEDNVFKNPTAENIAKEMLLMCWVIFEDEFFPGLTVHSIELYETPNCSVVVGVDSLELSDTSGFEYHKGGEVRKFRDELFSAK